MTFFFCLCRFCVVWAVILSEPDGVLAFSFSVDGWDNGSTVVWEEPEPDTTDGPGAGTSLIPGSRQWCWLKGIQHNIVGWTDM